MKASKVEQHSSSGAVVGSSYDLLPLILINLPVKSLVRFQTISKQWKFIISDDRDFATKHSRKSSTAPYGVFINRFYFKHETTEFVPLFRNPSGYAPSLFFLNGIVDDLVQEAPYCKKRKRVFVAQRILSCNGLLLCIFSLVLGGDRKHVLVVCNPTTKHFKVLPQIGKLEGFTLVFSPSESPHYRVVAFNSYWNRAQTEIHMYSSETDRWQLVRVVRGCWDLVEPKHVSGVSNGVFFIGSVYWLGKKYRNDLLYYNLNSNHVGTLKLPPNVFEFYQHLDKSCGRLFFIFDVVPHISDRQVNIYELDSNNMQWSFISQQRKRSMVEGICLPFKYYYCEYVPSLAPV